MLSVRRAARAWREERGQMLILFAGAFTILALAAVVGVDFGLWLSERRGAQKDVDLVALAGAFELFEEGAGFPDVDDATQLSATQNDLDPLDDLHNLQVKSLAFEDGFENDPAYCKTAPDTGERPNAVSLDVDHESRALFAGIFDIVAPEIGAHACARAGSLRSAQGLRPWIVSMFNSPCFDWVDDGDGIKEADDDEFIPQFGEDCIFRLESPSSQVGSVRLGDDEGDACNENGGGAAKYRENIIEGADAWCEIGDWVDTEPGLNTGPTFAALHELLSDEGECDALNGDGDGIDQFPEAYEATSGVPGPDVAFSARDCETPRALHILIIDEFDGTGFDTRPIEGIAAFYLQQCEEVDGDGNVLQVFEKCDVPGGAQANTQIRGFFMRVVELEGEVGEFDEFGTNVIRLVE